MNPSYDDIIERIPESPSWWQEGGVPRYGEFTPENGCASIYAKEIALALIECQSCGQNFKVTIEADPFDFEASTIADMIQNCSLHYGDPPNTGCCNVGASMNSEMKEVLEYWSRNDPKFTENGIVKDIESYMKWARNPLLEGRFA